MLERVSRQMPLLLAPANCEKWLERGGGLLSLGHPYEEADYFLEPTDELWSTGSSGE